MTATPAWPPQSTPRLFVESTLSDELELTVAGPQAHYLISVMRLKVGAPVKLFTRFPLGTGAFGFLPIFKPTSPFAGLGVPDEVLSRGFLPEP